MKILITGAQGFLGQKLSEALNKKEHKLYLYDLQSISNFSKSSNVVLIDNSDICSSQNFDLIPWSEIDYIFHLAAAGVKSSNRKLDVCTNVNINGTNNLLSKLENLTSFPKMVYARTFYENYVNSVDYISKDPYFRTKFEAYNNILRWSEDRENFTLITTNIFQVFGEHDDSNNLINYLINRLNDNKTASVSNFNIKRDWIYFDDAIFALSSIPTLNLRGHKTFDIGSGVLTSTSEIITMLANLLNKDENLVIEDVKKYRGDIQIQPVANNFVPGFFPRYTVLQGLEKMLSSMSY